ncbi:MAG TPA: ELWxxDGT repeat protein [Thermoanaerobaculia bacterium]
MHRLAILVASVLISTYASPGAAQPASILLDIRSSVALPGPQGGIGEILSIGSTAIFTAGEPGPSPVLWASDGTVGGTMPLHCCVGRLQPLGELSGAALFFSDGLWRSDGTPSGTFPLTVSGSEGPYACSGWPERPESEMIGGALFFAATTPARGCQLWRSDGTAPGTRQVSDIDDPLGYGIRLQDLTAFAGKLYFSVYGSEGPGLWRSDGTGPGTVLVRRFSSQPRFLTKAGSRLFFVAPDEGDELWATDGTPEGTRPLTRFVAPQPFSWADPYYQSPLPFFREIGGLLYFLANDVTGGFDLWRSDGTAAGTRRATNFGYASPFPREVQLLETNSRLVLVANDGINGWRLWTSNGTPETTRLLQGCPGGGCPTLLPDSPLVKLGQRVLFLGSRPGAGAAVWSSDGTAAGTRLVHDLCFPGGCSSEPSGLTVLLGRAFFVAKGPGESYELWQTDGSARGTRRIVLLGRNSFPYQGPQFRPVAVGERILFVTEVEWDHSDQLWSSDGTSEGTGPVTRFGTVGLGSDPRRFASDGAAAWFLAFDGEEQRLWRSEGAPQSTEGVAVQVDDWHEVVIAGGLAFFVDYSERLWRSDGTEAGTFRLLDEEITAPQNLLAFGNRLVFTLPGADGKVVLWTSDGTPAGTRKLFDLPVSYLSHMAVLGPELIFLDRPSSDNWILWRSDGTLAGTRPVELGNIDIRDPWEIVRVGNRLFFTAVSDVTEVWKIDGSGTVTPLLPGDDQTGKSVSNLKEHGGSLYFFGRSPETFQQGLWRSDGTAAGTVFLRSFSLGSSFVPVPLAGVGDRLYFAADDGEHGIELWSTDGTAAGTVMVKDIMPGRGSSSPSQLTAAGGRLFFNANDGEHGFELWESDGTEAGTRMVQDIAPGALSSQPQDLTATGSHLFFSADDGERGREPWVLPLTGFAGCQPSNEVLCLGGGRFRVEVLWRDSGGLGGTDRAGAGKAVPLTADTGWFWFYDSANVEVVVKVLDGRGRNGHHWIFYGALSNVEYALTVTDTWTGAARRYVNPPGRLGSVGDTHAFGPLGATSGLTLGPEAATWEPLAEAGRTASKAACAPSATRLCLQGGRFAVEARWRDFQSRTGAGQAVSLTSDTGWFWFFGPDNVEVVLKVLDGRPSNGKFWVFYGALSNVEYTLTVTDTQTGTVKTYRNPRGRLASVADTRAF